MVIAPEKFRDEELKHPKDVFLKMGFEVVVASTRRGEAVGMLGHRELVSRSLEDVAGETFDAVVVVGGAGAPGSLWNNATLADIIRRCHGMGRVVAAICLGGVALAKAGVLKGVRATVWKSDQSLREYSSLGVVFEDKPVVSQGKIITGQGPFAARDFARAVAAAVSGE